jgi:hypothetical protein
VACGRKSPKNKSSGHQLDIQENICYILGMFERGLLRRMAPSAAVAFAASLALITSGCDSQPVETKPSKIEHLAEKYDEQGLSKNAQDSFDFLVTLQPANAQQYTARALKLFAEDIQYSVVDVSRELIARGKLPDRDTDELNLAQDLIPRKTQKALKETGIDLVPVPPVLCDFDQDPYDYSNHGPGEFAVKQKDSRLEVPLGSAKEWIWENPMSTSEDIGAPAISTHLGELPCSALVLLPAPDSHHIKMVY